MRHAIVKPGTGVWCIFLDASELRGMFVGTAVVVADDEDTAVRYLSEYAATLEVPDGRTGKLVRPLFDPQFAVAVRFAHVTSVGFGAENGVVCVNIEQEYDD